MLFKSILNWWFRPKRYKHLFRIIREIKPKKIMEIGTWTGEKSLQMINLAAQFHPADQVSYYGFDLFEELTPSKHEEEISKIPPTKQTVYEKLVATGAKIHLYQGDTRKTLPQLIGQLPKMDFIFIDGGHSLETIANDWHNAQQLMHEGTMVIFDDYWNRKDAGAKPIIDKIDRSKFQVTILSPQDKSQKDWGLLKINFVEVKPL